MGTDGNFYAAAPQAGEAGWALIYKEDHEEDIMQEDMSTKKQWINEGVQLKALVDKGKSPPGGLWFAGEKYTVPNVDPKFEMGENTYFWAFAARPKKGVHIVSTGSQIVAGFYSEEKGQSTGNCKKVVLAFAEYLKGIGY